MAVATPRERLIRRLFDMTDEQIITLESLADSVVEDLSAEVPDEDDPTVGLISGPTDLSARAKQILYDEIDPKSGWTQKDRLP